MSMLDRLRRFVRVRTDDDDERLVKDADTQSLSEVSTNVFQ